MQRIIVEARHATDMVADDLDEIQHVERAAELDPNGVRWRHQALRRAPVSALSIGALPSIAFFCGSDPPLQRSRSNSPSSRTVASKPVRRDSHAHGVEGDIVSDCAHCSTK